MTPLRRTLVAVALLSFAQRAPSQTKNSGLQITPGSLAFPAQAVGSQSAALSISVNNPTNASIRIDQVLSSGIDFNAKSNCGRELTSGGSCSIEVMFKPAISGDRMGILEVLSSDAASPHFISLSGIGQ